MDEKNKSDEFLYLNHGFSLLVWSAYFVSFLILKVCGEQIGLAKMNESIYLPFDNLIDIFEQSIPIDSMFLSDN